MEVQPHEEPPSTEQTEWQKTVISLPSHELLNNILVGPREKVAFFNDIISGPLPNTQLTQKELHGELLHYGDYWLTKHLDTINKEYQSIVLTSPDTLPQRSELSFHIINRFVMPQWHRIIVSPKYPKMDAFDLQTAQIQLAMESAKIIANRTSFNEEGLLNNELYDLDAMISLLQMSIDSTLRNQPDIIVVPHPEIGSEHHQADFLIFEPNEDNTFQKREVQSADILDPSLAPGTIAVDVLENLKISSISRRPEFQNKAAFHKLILAREVAHSFNKPKKENEIPK